MSGTACLFAGIHRKPYTHNESRKTVAPERAPTSCRSARTLPSEILCFGSDHYGGCPAPALRARAVSLRRRWHTYPHLCHSMHGTRRPASPVTPASTRQSPPHDENPPQYASKCRWRPPLAACAASTCGLPSPDVFALVSYRRLFTRQRHQSKGIDSRQRRSPAR